jgi:hypothetical protein
MVNILSFVCVPDIFWVQHLFSLFASFPSCSSPFPFLFTFPLRWMLSPLVLWQGQLCWSASGCLRNSQPLHLLTPNQAANFDHLVSRYQDLAFPSLVCIVATCCCFPHSCIVLPGMTISPSSYFVLRISLLQISRDRIRRNWSVRVSVWKVLGSECVNQKI